jgi:hypothetical protein
MKIATQITVASRSGSIRIYVAIVKRAVIIALLSLLGIVVGLSVAEPGKVLKNLLRLI